MTYTVGITATRKGLTSSQLHTGIGILRDISMVNDIYGPIRLAQGCCVGGDEQLTIIAYTFGWKIVAHPPERTQYFSQIAYELARITHVRKPYLFRNQDIVDSCNELLAFPETETEELRSGTWATIRYARDRVFKPYRIVLPDGGITK